MAVLVLGGMTVVSAGEPPHVLPAYPLTPAGVQDQIKKRGAADVAHQILFESDAALDAVSAGIASGDKAWLQVAVALKETSGMDAASWLDFVVAAALEHAPANVLAVTGAFEQNGRRQPFDIRRVCEIHHGVYAANGKFTLTFTQDDLRAAGNRRSAAVAALADPALADRRNACLASLAKSIQALTQWDAENPEP